MLGELVLAAVVVVVIVILGPVLPVTVVPVGNVPVETAVDGLIHGATPYPGSLEEDGKVVPPGEYGGDDDLVGIFGGGSRGGGRQRVQIHVVVEQLPPRDASLVGLVPFVGLFDGLGLVEHIFEDLGIKLVGGDALARGVCDLTCTAAGGYGCR